MKAVRYHVYGNSDVLVHEEADRPTPAAGEVVVRVAGTAYNPVDSALRQGLLKDFVPVTFPHTPNGDLAGVVVEVGEGVTDWETGDAVIGSLPATTPGAAAEFVAAPADLLAAAPSTVDLPDAAALPTVGLTAWQLLFEHAGLKAGQRILVNGAGGAVGGYAVQLAARAGAEVTATASARSDARVRADGATHVVDYTKTPVAEALSGQRFDVVLQLAPGAPDELGPLLDLVADGGAFVSITGPVPEEVGRGVRASWIFVRSDAEQLAELVALVEAGELTVHVAERRPLADLARVHEEAEAGRLAGKTVLVP